MGGKSTSTSDPKINQLSIQSSSLGLPITIGWGRNRIKCNLIWYNGFTAIPHTTKQSGGKGLGGSSTNTTYSYTASVIMGLCEGPVQGVRTVYRDKDVYQDHVTTLSWDGVSYGTTTETALQQAGLSFAPGNVGQTPWAYVTSLYPAQALGYSEIAYAYAQDYALNDSASMPNHSFEIDFAIQLSGQADANPKDVATDFLTNSRYGVPGWASGLLGDLTDWSNYCLANNLLMSPVLEEQRTASDILTEWTEATNSAAFWSEGVLKIRTYGDGAATGNGVTWTPDLSPDYDLTEDDFIPDNGAPVKLEIVDQSDAYNVVQVEFLDRANQYNVAIATADDNANITAFGQRKQDPTQYHCLCDAAIARHSAQLLLQRTLYRRDIYSFKLPWNFVLLEPMDYVTLTTTTDELQLSRQLVQIVGIDEDEDGLLSFTAEGINVGAASAALYHSHSGSAVTVNTSVAPGSVAAPILINAPSALTQMDPEVWCAVSAPSAAWGGCDVWASADDVHFQKVGRIDGPARVGTTTATLASHADPDTVNTLSVDLSACQKTLDSATAANANAGSTLIYVGGELMGYQTATLTSAWRYDLTSLRRGLYGTAAASHASGSAFARLDDAVFKFPYTSLNVGRTIYLKFVSFNVFGSALEDISTVTTYPLALLGSGAAVDWRVVADDAASDAAAAQAAADAANAELADIASDNLLTPDEKPRVIYDRDIIAGEQGGIDAQATAFGITTEKTAYDTAVSALATYLAGLTAPFSWSDLTGNTTIVGTTFRNTFEAVYSARQTLLNKIAAVAKARGDQGVTDAATAQAAANAAASAASAAQASANSALTEITAIVSDSVLDKSEKPAVIQDWTVLYNEQSGIDAQAAGFGITTEKTTYDTAISALATYLTSLSPAWYDTTTDTPITRSTFLSKFTDVYYDRQALLNKIADVAKARADQGVSAAATAQAAAGAAASAASIAQSSANTALSEITTIVSDSILDRSEKPQVVADYDLLLAEQSGIDAQALAYGITAEKTNYDNGLSALTTYLTGLSPAYYDYTTDTAITRSTFISAFQAAYTSRTALLNRIAAVAGTVASWAGVSGSGKPADNADVTATTLANLLAATAAYGSGTTYAHGQFAKDQGAVWVYINATAGSGNAPPTLPMQTNAYWQAFALPGANGSNGSNGAPGSPGADAVIVTPQPASIQLQGDAGGSPIAGSLPFTIVNAAASAGGAVAITAINIVSSDSCTSSTSGVGVTISAVAGTFGSVTYDVTAGTQTVRVQVTYSVSIAGADGNVATVLTYNDNVSGGTYAQEGATTLVANANSSGAIDVNLTGSYKVGTGITLQTKIQYRAVGGTFSDVSGSENVGTPSYTDSSDGPAIHFAGKVNGTGPYHLTGLTANGPYEFRMMARVCAGPATFTNTANFRLTATQP